LKQLYSKVQSLLFNFSIRGFANLFSKAISLITLPIIARALGPESYGNYNLITLITFYTTLPLGLLGLRSYGIREIAGGSKPKSYAVEVVSMHLSISIISVLFSFAVIFIFFKNDFLFNIALIFGYISVFGQALNLEFYYVSQKNLAFPTYASLAGQLLFAAGVILLIKKPTDYLILILLSSITLIISDTIQIAKYKTENIAFKLKLMFRQTFTTFKETYVLGISQNLEGLVPTIPQILLPSLSSVYALGIYTGGTRIYAILVLFYVTFFYALAPYLVKLNNYTLEKQKKYYLLLSVVVLIASTSIGIFLYYFGDVLVALLLGDKFDESKQVFNLISITIIPLTPLIMLIGNILIYTKNEKYYLISLIVSGIAVLISSPYLIIKYSTMGAVYANIISLVSSLLLLIFFLKKILSKKVVNQ